MKKLGIVKFICTGGILVTLAVLFQSAPVLLPAIGLLLSPLSTLPIAIASYIHILLGASVYFVSAILLTLVSVQEAMILLFTTGLLGITMGTLINRKGKLVSILVSSIMLALGMIFLTFLVDISVFGDFTSSLSTASAIVLFIAFSSIYTVIWHIFLKGFMKRLDKVKSFTM